MNCKVMGIVNVTPDSFSDGGQFFKPEEAVRRAMNMIEEGADIIDLGGESTRPGATPLTWQEEWRRIEPVLRELGSKGVLISIDTYHPETAERALAMGAKIINCVYERSVSEMIRVMNDAAPDTELVVPSTSTSQLLNISTYTSTSQLLNTSTSQLLNTSTSRLYLDPMIGFGTTREEDLALLKSVPELAKRGRVLVGASRKRIVKKLTGEKVTGKNLGGNLAIALWCAMNGAAVVRVHDVRETVQALKVVAALTA